MRDPADVIDQILKVIPSTETELRGRLVKLRADSWFYPPEGKRPVWECLESVLTDAIGQPPASPWALSVSRIVRGEA